MNILITPASGLRSIIQQTLVNDFLAKLGNNSQIRQAALVRLMEAILGEVSQENVAQIRGKHKNRESGEETSHA